MVRNGLSPIFSAFQPSPVWTDGFIILQSLSAYIIENLSSIIKIVKVDTNVSKYQTQTIPKKFQTVKILPKWQNFVNSGHTESDLGVEALT